MTWLGKSYNSELEMGVASTCSLIGGTGMECFMKNMGIELCTMLVVKWEKNCHLVCKRKSVLATGKVR